MQESRVNIDKKEGTAIFIGIENVVELNKILMEKFPFLQILDNGLSRGTERHVYHLSFRGVNKKTAIELIQKLTNTSQSNFVAIGDAPTDLEMDDAVDKLYLVRNILDTNPELKGQINKLENAFILKKRESKGWVEFAQKLIEKI